MTARPRMMALEIDEELHAFLTLMVSDAGPYQSVSAYVEDLIRRDRASQGRPRPLHSCRWNLSPGSAPQNPPTIRRLQRR